MKPTDLANRKENKMNRQEMIEKLKHNWRPLYKLIEEEQQLLWKLNKNDRVYWSSVTKRWVRDNANLFSLDGHIFRVHKDYTEEDAPDIDVGNKKTGE